jgi:hypothetical protein
LKKSKYFDRDQSAESSVLPESGHSAGDFFGPSVPARISGDAAGVTLVRNGKELFRQDARKGAHHCDDLAPSTVAGKFDFRRPNLFTPPMYSGCVKRKKRLRLIAIKRRSGRKP